MKHVFGPVPSRRLGQSLGIDPVPLKTCNWNCVYCQLGRTRPVSNERKNYFSPEDILAEVKAALPSYKPGEIDWITFIGSGETSLHAGLGWMIREVKSLTPLPVAVITNGSLLYLDEVRLELSAADAVLPTLDAGSESLYRKINRPHPKITYNRVVDGLITFRKEYQGKLWIEVMLINGVNDTEEALKDLAGKLKRIQPDEVHILQPTRPPCEPWVLPANEEGLLRARAILGNHALIVAPASGTFDLSGYDNFADAVAGIVTRHPMREEEIIEALIKWSQKDVIATLRQLRKSQKVQVVERYGKRFWIASGTFFPVKREND